MAQCPQLKRPAVELYGYQYKPMLTFLWGLTPAMCEVTGRNLLPTYSYFRAYQQDDLCYVHSDRHACEHSLSMTLAYSDGKSWTLDVSQHRGGERAAPITKDFAGQSYSSVRMQPGDAVLYQGVHYRHGRVTPNPNRWSAHMFLHWVDADGPFKAQAFDGKSAQGPEPADFGVQA
jgi:hypothetical protein